MYVSPLSPRKTSGQFGAENKTRPPPIEFRLVLPPLEAKKLLFSLAASQKGEKTKKKLLFVDVKKAHLNGKCDEPAYVELPEEVTGSKGKCGKLAYWLYGMRPAARAWEEDYSGKFEEEGYVRGKAAATTFYNEEKDVRLVVHGDDFTFTGEKR